MINEKHFIEDLNEFAYDCHELAIANGFWEDDNPNKGEKIALIHSEVSEVLEAVRKPKAFGHLSPEFSLEEEELADIIIRVLDYAQGFELDVTAAMVRKHEFNRNRPYKHGKEF